VAVTQDVDGFLWSLQMFAAAVDGVLLYCEGQPPEPLEPLPKIVQLRRELAELAEEERLKAEATPCAVVGGKAVS
jgi:hypothetical protein